MTIALDQAVYVASSVALMPYPSVPSTKLDCAACGQEVWVDDRAVAHAKQCEKVICVPCVVKAVEEGKLKNASI